MPGLSETDRNQAIGMLAAEAAKREVARRFNCNVSTISRLQRRFQQTGTVRDRPRPGHPRITTARQDQQLRVDHLRDRFQTATDTARQIVGRHG